MPQVGPKAAVPPDVIKQKLLDFDILKSDGKIKSRCDSLWIDIAAALGNLVKPVSLYFFVFQNRYDALTYYKKNKGIEEPVEDSENLTIDDDVENERDDDLDQNESDDNESLPPAKKRAYHGKNLRNLSFDIEISKEEWSEIVPITRISKNGQECKILQDGWTDVVRKTIWNVKKLPCVYSFKRHVIDDPEAYVLMYGSCTVCEAKIKIILLDKPDESASVTFLVRTVDSTDIPHAKKARLQGVERKKVQQELKYIKPKEWRREKAKEIMDHGNFEPPFLYNLPALQKASQDKKNEDLGIQKGVSLMDSIMGLTESVEFNKFIQNISIKKFYVTYWSPEQIELHNEILKVLNNPFSLDATGSVVIPLKIPNTDQRTCFLSVFITHIDGIIVPVCQTISEINDTIFYVSWLREFLKSGAKCPKEVVTDMGKALQNAISLAFNTTSFSEYNDRCLEILKGNNNKLLKLRTQLRTDISHLVHAVTKWPCIAKAAPRVKDLYKRCIGFMSTIDNIESFTEFLEQILIVGSSKMHDDRVINALKGIIIKIKTFTMDTNEKEKEDNDKNIQKDIQMNNDDDDNNKEGEEKTLIYQFLRNIKDSVIKDNTIIEDYETPLNDYYLPEFIDHLMDLCKEFPCWTNVMNRYFNNTRAVATSSRSENYFGQCKRSLLENKAPIRLDKFLIKHCRQINEEMKIARAAINNIILERNLKNKKNTYIVKNTHNYSHDYLYEVEKWGNQYSLEEHYESETEKSSKSQKLENKQNNKEIEVLSVSAEENLIKDNYIFEVLKVENEHCTVIEEQVDILGNLSDIPVIDDTSFLLEETPAASSSTIEEEKEAPVKLRGTYVRPAPDFDIHLQKGKISIKTGSRGNIRNGGTLQAKAFNKQNIVLTNTCAFDSITEILTFCCCYQLFRDFIEAEINHIKEKQHQCYASAVLNHFIKGNVNAIYTPRLYILMQFLKLKNNYLDCNNNVAFIFRNLMNKYSCTKEIIKCDVCLKKEIIDKAVIPLPNLNIVLMKNYATLEEGLNKYLKTRCIHCQNCDKFNGSQIFYELGPYLYIDVEDAYKESTYAKDHGIDGKEFKSGLGCIPPKLQIKNVTYILGGAIEYIPGVIGHYVAYCRSISGSWEKRNDLNKKKESIKKTLPDLRFAAIFYVKCSI